VGVGVEVDGATYGVGLILGDGVGVGVSDGVGVGVSDGVGVGVSVGNGVAHQPDDIVNIFPVEISYKEQSVTQIAERFVPTALAKTVKLPVSPVNISQLPVPL
jgi:hypothetical protein